MAVQNYQSYAAPAPVWGRTNPVARVREAQRSDSSDMRATLEVVTDDGDKINLSFDLDQAVNARSIAVSGHGNRVTGSERSSATRLNVTVKTEGSLEADELRDLRSLLQTLARVVSNAGRGATGLAAPAWLGTLASFDFAYSRQESWQTSETRVKRFG